MRRRTLMAGGAALALPLPVRTLSNRHAPADVVIGWNRALLTIVRTVGAQPATVHPTRSFAIMHAAQLDAVLAGTAPVAAAAQAAHDVLAVLYPTQGATFDRLLAADLATVPAGPERDRGILVGRRAAARWLRARAKDGSAAVPPPPPPVERPGDYRPTPPAFAPAVFTHWSHVTPFVLRRADQFRPGPYPDLAGARYARAVTEVKLLGQDRSTARSADQTTQARFWAAPIWNYWNEITQSVLTARRAGLVTAARVFADLARAFADGVIAFYDAKYSYHVWRPVTAIRESGTDGNPATIADTAWTPLATTPADPAYPGAHSVIAQAGARVLTAYFGPAVPITVSSEALAGVTRTFHRFQDAADEAGLSRIYAGVHTRLDHDAGQRLGRQVAGFLLARGGVWGS